MNSSFATIVHLAFYQKPRGVGLPACRRGTGGATAPIPYHKGETCHSLNENFLRNPVLCGVLSLVPIVPLVTTHSLHTALHNAKLSLLQQRFPLTAIQKIVAVAGLPVTFPMQLLRSALDVDEPAVRQNIQRPFDAGA